MKKCFASMLLLTLFCLTWVVAVAAPAVGEAVMDQDVTASAVPPNAWPPTLGYPFSTPGAYVFAAMGSLHIDYVSSDGHVHQLRSGSYKWSHTDLTQAAGAPLDDTLSSPAGYVFQPDDPQGTQHVVYVTRDGRVHDLFTGASPGWRHNDLTKAANAPLNASGSPVAYVFAAQGTQHVDYVSTDGHVNELSWTNGAWRYNDLSIAAGAPLNALPGSKVAAYVFAARGTRHVDYAGTDGHIHELLWDSTGWHHNDLTIAADAPDASAGSSLTGYSFDAQGTQHVDYMGTDAHIHELLWDSTGWHHTDLSNAAGALIGAITSPVGYVVAAEGRRYVDYSGDDGHVYELWSDSTGWHYNDLTTASGASTSRNSPVIGILDPTNGQRHVIYIRIDGHISHFWDNLVLAPPPPPLPPSIDYDNPWKSIDDVPCGGPVHLTLYQDGSWVASTKGINNTSYLVQCHLNFVFGFTDGHTTLYVIPIHLDVDKRGIFSPPTLAFFNVTGQSDLIKDNWAAIVAANNIDCKADGKIGFGQFLDEIADVFSKAYGLAQGVVKIVQLF